MIILPILTTSLINFLIERLGDCTFWTWERKGWAPTRAHSPRSLTSPMFLFHNWTRKKCGFCSRLDHRRITLRAGSFGCVLRLTSSNKQTPDVWQHVCMGEERGTSYAYSSTNQTQSHCPFQKFDKEGPRIRSKRKPRVGFRSRLATRTDMCDLFSVRYASASPNKQILGHVVEPLGRGITWGAWYKLCLHLSQTISLSAMVSPPWARAVQEQMMLNYGKPIIVRHAGLAHTTTIIPSIVWR